jgi:SRSO17 transposase
VEDGSLVRDSGWTDETGIIESSQNAASKRSTKVPDNTDQRPGLQKRRHIERATMRLIFDRAASRACARKFKTKREIALEQLRWACEADLPRGVVLIDGAYGADSRLRAGMTTLGLTYAVGIQPG